MRSRRLVLLLSVACLLPACAENGSPGAGRDLQDPAQRPLQPSGNPFTFVVIGDFGTGEEAQLAVAARMCSWREENPFGHVFTTGDNIYPSGEAARFDDAFFGPYDCLLSDGVRFHATLGNHDVLTNNGRPELNEPAFGFKRRNYVVRRGGVRFVMVDSNALRKRWLRRRLPAEKGDRWTVVLFHHPVFSSGPHGSTEGFRPTLPRMFRNHGVDLVLNGHEHHYERIKPRGKIRYVVTGGGGASLYSCGNKSFTALCAKRYHFLYVDADEKRLKVTAVPRSGKPFDVFRTRGRD